MTQGEKTGNEVDQLRKDLEDLELRISRIETHLGLSLLQNKRESQQVAEHELQLDGREGFELKVGLYWFAKVGIAALIIGIGFLLLQPFDGMNPFFAPVLGYLSGLLIGALSRALRNVSSFTTGYLKGGQLLVFYFSTLRLHYFSRYPAIINNSIEVLLLIVVTAISFAISLKRGSVHLTALSITFGYCTILIMNSFSFVVSSIFLMSTVVVYLSLKKDWYILTVYGILLTYFSHLNWFLSNPIFGGEVQIRSITYGQLISILLWPVIFSISSLFRKNKNEEGSQIIAGSILNSIIGYGLLFILTASSFPDKLFLSNLLASLTFLFLAVVFWLKEKSRFQTFFYSMTGYVALSAAIIAQFKMPDFFLWLCWQSFLVVSTAILFESKFIVVANFVIYLLIFVSYLFYAGTIDIASISFGIVALLSARLLNWQKHRLNLRTEKMRNAYLMSAFIIIPYALYHAMPEGYIGISWLITGFIYYIIGIVLKNLKYRWMAFGTFLITAIYMVIAGTTMLSGFYRILSFLLLGVVLLFISYLYARKRLRSPDKNSNSAGTA